MTFELDIDKAEIRHPRLDVGEHAVKFLGMEYINTNFGGNVGKSAKFDYLVAQSTNPKNPRGSQRTVIIHGLADSNSKGYGKKVGDVLSACMTISGEEDPKDALEHVLSGTHDGGACMCVVGKVHELQNPTPGADPYVKYTYSPYETEAE